MSASGPYVCEECRKLDQNWYDPCPHWKIVKAARSEARREMIEDIANALLVACDEVEAAGEEAGPIAIFKRCELKIRALMEKEAKT